MLKPIKLEILSLLPTTFKQCPSCEEFFDQSGIGQQVHNQILDEYPQDLRDEGQHLATLMAELTTRFGDDILIHVIDPQSLPGFFKSIKYRVRKYPAFIIDGKELVVGWDRTALDHALETHSASREI